MKMFAFSVLDKAVGAYTPPFFQRSKGEALRAFIEACNDPKSSFNKHPDDYCLFAVGEWNDLAGMLAPKEPERLLSSREALNVQAASGAGAVELATAVERMSDLQ